jgi:hypothetical protein
VCSVKPSRDLQMQFAAAARFAEGLNHERLLALKVVLTLLSGYT